MVRRKPGKNGLGNGRKQPWTGLKWTGNGQEMIVYGFCWLILSCTWKLARMDESGWWKWTARPVECGNKMVSDVQEMVRKRPGDGLKWPGNGQEKDAQETAWNGREMSSNGLKWPEMVRKRSEVAKERSVNGRWNGQELVVKWSGNCKNWSVNVRWNGPKWSPNGHEMDHFDTFVVVCRGETLKCACRRNGRALSVPHLLDPIYRVPHWAN